MARKKAHEEHENHERYLVTYVDLLLLLCSLFIILYAMSQMDERKYEEVAESLSIAFNQGGTSMVDLGNRGTVNKEARQEVSEEELQEMRETKEKNQLDNVKKDIEEVIKEKNLEDKISTMLDKDGLHIILSDEIMFESGQAELKPTMKAVLSDIGLIIKEIPNHVDISGHTDDIPIKTIQFPSNWELSSARAVAVLKEILNQQPTIDPYQLSASGYGEYHPIAENDTAEGRAKNRRVEILIERMQF